MECRHLDGNSLNNDLDNLAWGTHYENVQDSIIHDRIVRGERHGRSRLTNAQVVEIRQLLGSGTTGSELARRYQVCAACISNIKNQKHYQEAKIKNGLH